MKEIIQKLVETFSPSGYEDAIRRVVRAEVEPLADEICVDALGNLIVREGKDGKNGKKIMLAAHMDEIGLIASHIDEKGFVRFTTLGVIRPHTLVGARLRFLNGTKGIVGAEYLTKPSELIPIEKMFIDVGATSPRDCPVKIGDVAAIERSFLDLGNRLIAKSMDGRVGVAVLIECMRRLKSTPHEFIFVFTTQAEVGARGAMTSNFSVDPDIGLAVDTTPAADTPDSHKSDIALGKGPTVRIKDDQMVAYPQVVDWVIRVAEKSQIPFQREVLTTGGTEASAIQLTRAGVLAGSLGIPCRYLHSPSEMVDFGDVQNAVRLLVALLSSPVDVK